MWTPDDIVDANPPGPGQSRSVLQRLVATGQTDLSLLAEVAGLIDQAERPLVAAFFQLPSAVAIDAGWHRLPTHTLDEGMSGSFSFRTRELVYSDSGDLSLKEVSSGGMSTWPVITQVAGLFPVWGVRALHHGKYLHHAENGTRGNPVIVPQGPSWIDNRPITLGVYETNLAKRLMREIQAILRSFLPAYAIASLTETPVPEQLYGYHAMPAPGRIVQGDRSVSAAKALIRRSVQAAVPVLPFAPIEQAMRTKFRTFGRFESQLFAMERLRRDGETALALIGGVSLLEWTLKAIAGAGNGGRFRGLADVADHPSIDFFSAEELHTINLARRTRNTLVHEEPPARHSLTTGGPTIRAQIAQPDQPFGPERVRQLLEIAFKAFREANKRGVTIVALEA